ncbi:MAG: ABC transporter ATP-binding protein [Synergistaceae bacterium]|jgi:lipopolysaccharide transport system ATP-binding protein|nr:ABC transporter ATP-binding protein [Synergistaceae bacterium]
MSDTVIKIENLGKKYTLAHKRPQNYITFRDVLMDRAKRLGYRLTHPLFSNNTTNNTTRAPSTEEFWALSDIAFDVKQGERVGIIGRNGAGKSTLLKVLSRITEPTMGRVSIKGRIASLLEVGTGFHPELTGRENIYLNGAILGMSKAEIKKNFDAIVDFAGVERFLDTPVKHYSSGMYVRLAFAVAAHLDTEILLIDEVLAVGDAEFQKKCMGKMDEVSHKEGRTILFVSHNMGAIGQLTERVFVLEKGKLIFADETKKAVDFYVLQAKPLQNMEDLETLPRKFYYSQEVVISRVYVDLPEKGITTNTPLRFRMTLKAKRDITASRVSATIFSDYAYPIGSFFTDSTLNMKQNETAEYIVEVRDHRLAPGSYHCGFAVGTGNQETAHRDYDVVFEVSPFEVLYSHEVLNWNANWGGIVYSAPSIKKAELTQ